MRLYNKNHDGLIQCNLIIAKSDKGTNFQRNTYTHKVHSQFLPPPPPPKKSLLREKVTIIERDRMRKLGSVYQMNMMRP